MWCLIIILLIFLIISLIRINKIKNVSKNEKNELLKNLENTDKLYQTTLAEKNIAQIKVEDCSKEISKLNKSLDEANKKLDFYLNIEKDSGDLNTENENENREQLVEDVVKLLKNKENSSYESIDKEAENAGSSLDAEQASILNEIEYYENNYFITGKAGTGKSFLLDVFRESTLKQHIVLAPTGIAALNVRGATLHSVFGYNNLVTLDIDNITSEKLQLKSEKRMILKQVSTIIIDEISMVRADTLDRIDRILKLINNNQSPFGGKQMIFFGDLFQLPPVAKQKEQEYLFDKYNGIHFFCSDAYKQGKFVFRELTINHRQKDDLQYFDLLNRVRDGSLTSEDIRMLNTRVEYDDSVYDRFTTLLPTKAAVEKLNKYHIQQLDTPEYKYQAEIVFNKYSNNNHNLEAIFPITNILCLKKGALVMMVANDTDHRWVNGTLGIVNRLSQNRIFVSINKRTYEIKPVTFVEQEITYIDGKIRYEDVLKVSQYPLVLAYAITIHKSQGQTYKNIVCDVNDCFADGQTYVALSRCTSLNGLHLKRPIDKANIRIDKCVQDFYNNQR